jgi:hypothetical protein
VQRFLPERQHLVELIAADNNRSNPHILNSTPPSF